MNHFWANVSRIDWTGLGTKVALWLLIATLAMLVLPIPTLQSLYLQQWVANNGFSLGLMVVFSASYLLGQWLLWLLHKATYKRRQLEQQQQFERKIALLDGQERAILREYFLQASSVVRMPYGHPAVSELLKVGILEEAGSVQHYAIEGTVGLLRLNPNAKQLLSRQALRLPEANMTDEQRQHLLSSRPDFISTLNGGRRHAA
ncbi:superinfection exclusion B family protein [uncultured Ferrimonas sp.]|uniref:superinfection exclusion B family protein n=1 Tax=uncultured Ferrimonas sp. TaxID=432640 RepID=UPI002625D628|nr:superinfection exclusion B family protein [uncultured Ferrimonas sp.]